MSLPAAPDRIISVQGRLLEGISRGLVTDVTELEAVGGAPAHTTSDVLTEMHAQAAQLGAYSYDVVSDTHIISPELKRLLGRSADGPSLTDMLQFVPADDREALSHEVQRILQRVSPYVLSYRVLTPSGSILHVEDRGRTVGRSILRPVSCRRRTAW